MYCARRKSLEFRDTGSRRLQPAQPKGCGYQFNSQRVSPRGQSLILVILIMIAVAAAAALFVTLITGIQARTFRQAEIIAIDNIAEAGVRYADYQLTYSAEGADWRPIPSAFTNPYPYQFGRGEFRLALTYNPQPDQPLSRFIKIECTARLQNNPFLKRSRTAYKPILLADYLRFVTNRDRSSLPAVLGVPEVVQGIGTYAFTTLLGARAGNGTAIFTASDDTVTGIGTSWSSEVKAGDLIKLNADGLWCVVSEVVSDTEITLAAAYLGSVGESPGLYSLSNGTSPLCLNSDVNWAGPTNLMLGLNERMEVLGGRSGYVPWHLWTYRTGTASFANGSTAVTGAGTSWISNGKVLPGDWIKRAADPESAWAEIASVDDETSITLKSGYAGATGSGLYEIRKLYAQNVRYEEPPLINTTDPASGQSRYLLLTRDSGTWQSGGSGWYNTGWYGYGNGIYIDDFSDIQWGHDLAALRDEWMNPQADNDPLPDLDDDNGPWDRPGWSYTPPGLQIILHPQGQYGITYPYIEMVRDDPDPVSGGYWRDANGGWLGDRTYPDGITVLAANTQWFPFPSNGVIFAEGNVRVAGVLPPATSGDLERYCADQGTADPADDERYFDLTIVSDATIYIEGDVMSPKSYENNGGEIAGSDYEPGGSAGEIRNSRLALLARDHVCLNLTAAGVRLDPNAAGVTGAWSSPDSNCWNIAADQQVSFWFKTWQPAGSALVYLRHAGQATTATVWNDGAGNRTYSRANLYVDATDNGTADGSNFPWDGANPDFLFSSPEDPTNPSPAITPDLRSSNRTLDRTNLQDRWEVSVRSLPGAGAGAPAWAGVRNYLSVRAPATSTNPYRLAGFQVLPSRINVDALIYAQEGSWFVLPGPWFNGAWNYLGNYLANDPVADVVGTGVPSYRRAVSSIPLINPDNPGFAICQPRVYINGAISENHTAALGDAHDWLSKWGGRSLGFGAADPETTVTLAASDPRISYIFDEALRSAVYETTNADGDSVGLAPRLPKLPCPPGLIVWEQP